MFGFCDNSSYHLGNGTRLRRPILHTAKYGIESITNLAALNGS